MQIQPRMVALSLSFTPPRSANAKGAARATPAGKFVMKSSPGTILKKDRPEDPHWRIKSLAAAIRRRRQAMSPPKPLAHSRLADQPPGTSLLNGSSGEKFLSVLLLAKADLFSSTMALSIASMAFCI